MFADFIAPLLDWLGVGLVPFLVLIILVIMLIKS